MVTSYLSAITSVLFDCVRRGSVWDLFLLVATCKKWHKSGTNEKQKPRRHRFYGVLLWWGWWDLNSPTKMHTCTQTSVIMGLFGFVSAHVH